MPSDWDCDDIELGLDLQGKLIEESKKMVLDTQTRMTKAHNELQGLVVRPPFPSPWFEHTLIPR